MKKKICEQCDNRREYFQHFVSGKKEACRKCNGLGRIERDTQIITCPTCWGQGKIGEVKSTHYICPKCRGIEGEKQKQ